MKTYPVPVGAMGGDGNVGRSAVDGFGIVDKHVVPHVSCLDSLDLNIDADALKVP